jgi:hypothetical protein
VLFTRSLAKLGLHFFDLFVIFYALYKILQNSHTIEDTDFQTGPWKFIKIHNHTPALRIGPQKESPPCNWVLGVMAGAARRNPARPTVGTAREECREGLGCARGRFGN